MAELVKDLVLVSLGMGIGVVLMCIAQVSKMADEEMVDFILGKEFEEHMLYIIHLIGTNPDMIIN